MATIVVILILSASIIGVLTIYVLEMIKLIKKKDAELKIKEAEMHKQAEEQAEKIAVLKSLVEGQDKVLAEYRAQRK